MAAVAVVMVAVQLMEEEEEQRERMSKRPRRWKRRRGLVRETWMSWCHSERLTVAVSDPGSVYSPGQHSTSHRGYCVHSTVCSPGHWLGYAATNTSH